MALTIHEQPEQEPVTLAEARVHLRLDGDGSSSDGHPEDDLIEALIAGAREWAEGYLQRSIAEKVYQLTLDAFPADEIELAMPPVQSIVSVSYIDADGIAQTMATDAYVLDNKTDPGWLYPADGTEWPETDDVVNAVTIRFRAGYSSPGSSEPAYPLPKSIRAGVLLLLHDLYENRGNAADKSTGEVPLSAERVMQWHRLGMGV